MEAIKLLVQYLIVIVMLSIFLELIMPDNTFKPYIRLVMGLVIIVAVLQCFGAVGGRQWFTEVEAFSGGLQPGSENISNIMVNGKKINADMKKQALQQYRQGIAGQVAALVDMKGSYNAEMVEVALEEDPDSVNYGQVKDINIVLSQNQTTPGADNKIIVESLRVDLESTGASRTVSGQIMQPDEEAGKLAVIVANFYNLEETRVKVLIKR